MYSISSSGIPMPSSLTINLISLLCLNIFISIFPPSFVYFIALDNKFIITWVILYLSAFKVKLLLLKLTIMFFLLYSDSKLISIFCTRFPILNFVLLISL
jgi:hypothetical protein